MFLPGLDLNSDRSFCHPAGNLSAGGSDAHRGESRVQTFTSKLSCLCFVHPAQALFNSTPQLLARDRAPSRKARSLAQVAGQLKTAPNFNGSEKFPSTFSRTSGTLSRRRWSACRASWAGFFPRVPLWDEQEFRLLEYKLSVLLH